MTTRPDIWRACDVLVIGAGASGIPAALAAARAGARVILLEEDAAPGGAPVDQYVCMPCGGPRSGIPQEMVAALERDHALTDRPVDRWWDFWYLPAAFQKVALDFIAMEKRLELICGVRTCTPLVEERHGQPRVVGAVVPGANGLGERRLTAPVVIDATGTGEFAVAAGCAAMYGEDSRDEFGEALAPEEPSDRVQLCTWQYFSQKLAGAPYFDVTSLSHAPNECGVGFLGGRAAAGAAERDAGVYLHWGCRVRCRDTRDPVAVAEAQREGLELMAEDHRRLRAAGYAVHLPPRLGVRETRRIVGEAVVTATDLVEGRIPEDSIMITQRAIDIWQEGKGALDWPEVKPYGVPYRALVAKGVDGLLVVGKAMSGTHLAMASYRVQVLLGIIGQAAGVAAAQCAAAGCQPREADLKQLLATLTAPPQNVVLDPEGCTPPGY